MEDVSAREIELDLERLESGLRQLKIQYDMFFAGAVPRQPFEMRAQLERLIRRYTNAPIRKYAHRFHFNALLGRYNSLSELWAKTIRALEEGDRQSPAAQERPDGEKTLTRCRVRDPLAEQEALREVHARYVEARRKAGEANGKVQFDAFVRGIAAQAEQLRAKADCEEIELRVVLEDGKVRLKARPGR